jgi:hypothetical protein
MYEGKYPEIMHVMWSYISLGFKKMSVNIFQEVETKEKERSNQVKVLDTPKMNNTENLGSQKLC